MQLFPEFEEIAGISNHYVAVRRPCVALLKQPEHTRKVPFLELRIAPAGVSVLRWRHCMLPSAAQ